MSLSVSEVPYACRAEHGEAPVKLLAMSHRRSEVPYACRAEHSEAPKIIGNVTLSVGSALCMSC